MIYEKISSEGKIVHDLQSHNLSNVHHSEGQEYFIVYRK